MKKINEILNTVHDYYLESFGEVVNAGCYIGHVSLRDAINKILDSADEGTIIYASDKFDPLYDSGYTNIYYVDETVCDEAYVLLYCRDKGWCWYPMYKTIHDTFEIDIHADCIPCSIID